MKLEAKGISVAIKGCSIVRDCALSLQSGEMVGLIGPNGAGKSTLLKAVLGLREKSAGTVTLDGRDMASIPARERARAVAFLPQDRRVEWRLPAYDIVMLGRYPHQTGFGGPTPADQAAVAKALAAVDSTAIADRPVSVLSGGERTRVLLARALAVEAPLLLVDEPITALDPYHQIHVMEILHALSRQGVGVMAVLHDLAFAARFMDRLVLMGDGGIVRDGPPAEVLSDKLLEEVYRIDVVRGERDGQSFLSPWSRRGPGARP
jgi:iron complex transport system ATP-binding protein